MKKNINEINQIAISDLQYSDLAGTDVQNCFVIAIAKFLQAKCKESVTNIDLLRLIKKKLIIVTANKADGSFLAVPNDNFQDLFFDEEFIRTTKITDDLLDYCEKYDCIFCFTTTNKQIEGHCEFLRSGEIKQLRGAIKAAHIQITTIIILKV